MRFTCEAIRDRTVDLLLAKHALSHLSYGPARRDFTGARRPARWTDPSDRELASRILTQRRHMNALARLVSHQRDRCRIGPVEGHRSQPAEHLRDGVCNGRRNGGYRAADG